MPKHVVVTDECHRLLKMRAARLGVPMGAAVWTWVQEPFEDPLRCLARRREAGVWVRCDLGMAHAPPHEHRTGEGVAVRWETPDQYPPMPEPVAPLVTAQDAVAPLTMTQAELRAKAVSPSTKSEPVSDALKVLREIYRAVGGPPAPVAHLETPATTVFYEPPPDTPMDVKLLSRPVSEVMKAKSFTGPFSKAAQMGKKA